MMMDKRTFVVTMPNGERWGVPAEIIAINKADYYAKIDPNTTWQVEYDVMLYWFDRKNYEFVDWAKDNMDWDDVKDYAFLLPSPGTKDVNWQEGWVNGDYEFVTSKEADDAEH